MKSQCQSVSTIIVGGGITALSVAWRLHESNLPFIILEQSSRLGGQITTIKKNGFTFDIGPNTSTISFPEVRELFDYVAPYAILEIAKNDAHTRFIWKNNRYHPLPSNPIFGLFSPLFRFRDKLHILGEPFYKKSSDPNISIGTFAERRLGKSIVEYAVDPFIGGIYAGDPYNLTVRYALPKLYNLEAIYGSFIRGAIAKAWEKKSTRDKLATKDVFSVKGGFQELVNAIEHKISSNGIIEKNITIEDVSYTKNKKWNIIYRLANGERKKATSAHYVPTVRSDQLKGLLPSDVSSLLMPIELLEYAPITEIAFGFDHYKGLNDKAFGLLVPSIENRNVLGILFQSDCFSERVPFNDSRLFTVFMEGIRDRDKLSTLSREDIIQLAQKDLYDILKIDHSIVPSLIHYSRFPKAIPQYRSDTKERIHCIDELQKKYSGLRIGGAISDGIGLAHRIKQGSDIGLNIVSEYSRQ